MTDEFDAARAKFLKAKAEAQARGEDLTGRDAVTEFDRWERDRAIIATSNDLKYIAWQFDRLVDEVQGMSHHLRDGLAGVGGGVWLVALPLWIILGAYLWHLWRLYFA